LGLARRASDKKRNRVLLGATEHKCVLAIGRVIKEQLGLQVEHLPVDSEGRVELNVLKDALDESVLIVSMMAANNEIGTIQDMEGISEFVHSVGGVFHCDAAQAPCAMNLNAMAMHVDLLSLSAHKMYGPKGVGALFVRRELHDRIEPLIYGGGQQHNLRSGTVPTPLCVGMGAAAVLLNSDGATTEREKSARLQREFVEGLLGVPWKANLNGPELGPKRHPGNINIRFEGFSAHDILGALQPRLAASTGSACSTGTPEPSHVLRAIGLSDRQAESSIRFSLGRWTTDQDVAEAVSMIEDTLNELASANLMQAG